MIHKKIVVAITGASGSIYAKMLLDKLVFFQTQCSIISFVMSKNAKDIWLHELENKKYLDYPFLQFEPNDFFAPFASGSANYTDMIICPCSMGTLARIAQGVSDDLITRAADVMLKERKKLICVTRETPLHRIQLQNMLALTDCGAIIVPASPSFYTLPKTIEALVSSVVDRILDLININQNTFRWGN